MDSNGAAENTTVRALRQSVGRPLGQSVGRPLGPSERIFDELGGMTASMVS